jgi:hypothetical protein
LPTQRSLIKISQNPPLLTRLVTVLLLLLLEAGSVVVEAAVLLLLVAVLSQRLLKSWTLRWPITGAAKLELALLMLPCQMVVLFNQLLPTVAKQSWKMMVSILT